MDRPPLPAGRVFVDATVVDQNPAPLCCDVGGIDRGNEKLLEDEEATTEPASPASSHSLERSVYGSPNDSDRQMYRPRPTSAPMQRPGSATSASGRRARPLSAPKWGERAPSDALDERPESLRRQPVSGESLQALAGLTDDLLGIVRDDGDENNLDDLDLIESPRCDMSDAMRDYEIEHGRAVPPAADSRLRKSNSLESEMHTLGIIDDDEEDEDQDDYDSEEENEYAMRSVDVAMSRGSDAPRDAGRLRLAQQPVILEDELDITDCHIPVRQAREPRPATSHARPKSAVLDRPWSGKSRDGSGSKVSKSKRVSGGSSGRSSKPAGRVAKGHRDLVAEALAKDPKRYRRQSSVEWNHRPTSAQQRDMYLGTTYVE